MNRVLLLDTETTGLDPEFDRAIEVAAVVYDIGLWSVIESYATLMKSNVPNKAVEINRIPDEAIKRGADSVEAWNYVDVMAATCDCIVGHNCDFDRQFVPENATILRSKPWCCTQLGIEWPRQLKSGGTLISLMLEHGLGVVDPHRALNDCMAIARLFARCSELGFDVARMVEGGCEPRITIQALVSYANRDKAKSAGCHWEPETKGWIRSIRASQAEELPFKWKEVSK